MYNSFPGCRISRTNTDEESRWNVASIFASLLQGDIRRSGVPELETFDDDLVIAVVDELARLPNPVCGDSYIMVE